MKKLLTVTSSTVTGDNKHHWFQRRVQREQLERLQRELTKANDELDFGQRRITTLEDENLAYAQAIVDVTAERKKAQDDLREVGLQLLSMTKESHELTEERKKLQLKVHELRMERDNEASENEVFKLQLAERDKTIECLTAERNVAWGKLNAIASREANIAAEMHALGVPAYIVKPVAERPVRPTRKKSTKAIEAESEQAQ